MSVVLAICDPRPFLKPEETTVPFRAGLLDAPCLRADSLKELKLAYRQMKPVQTLDDLALQAVKLGRQLSANLDTVGGLPSGDSMPDAVDAFLRHLQMGRVVEAADLFVCEALERALNEALVEEITGDTFVPRVVGHDVDGEVCVVVRVPTYSARGEAIERALRLLHRFSQARDELLEVARAERLARQVLR